MAEAQGRRGVAHGHATHVAVMTQQVPFQGIAALVWLICQLHAAVLTNIAVDVEVFVH